MSEGKQKEVGSGRCANSRVCAHALAVCYKDSLRDTEEQLSEERRSFLREERLRRWEVKDKSGFMEKVTWGPGRLVHLVKS